MVQVIRLTEDFFGNIQDRASIPRHLVTTEFGLPLANEQIVVLELHLPPYTRHRHLTRRKESGVQALMSTLQGFISILNRQWRVFRLLSEISGQTQVLLVDQGLGLRLAAARLLGRRVPRIASVCYDPFPHLAASTRSRFPATIDRLIRQRLFSRIDLVVVVSEEQARWLRPLLSEGTKIAAIPMAIDLEVFKRKQAPTGDFVFMVDGILRDYETLSKAVNQMASPPSKLLLAHRLPLSPKSLIHLDEIRRSGCQVQTIHKATGAQLRQLYEACSLVIIPVLPSVQPAGLTALLEALAMGCAVVCSDASWTKEYAQNDKHVLFFETRNELSLAETMDRILTDPVFADVLRCRAKAQGRQFTFQRGKAAMRAALLDLVRGQRSTRMEVR